MQIERDLGEPARDFPVRPGGKRSHTSHVPQCAAETDSLSH